MYWTNCTKCGLWFSDSLSVGLFGFCCSMFLSGVDRIFREQFQRSLYVNYSTWWTPLRWLRARSSLKPLKLFRPKTSEIGTNVKNTLSQLFYRAINLSVTDLLWIDCLCVFVGVVFFFLLFYSLCREKRNWRPIEILRRRCFGMRYQTLLDKHWVNSI